MTLSRRIPLNPCDYLYYAHHRMLERTTRAGNLAYMMLDAEGHADPDLVREALAAAMAAHPVTIAPLKVSILTGRPSWRIPRSPDAAARRAAAEAFTCDDLHSAPDGHDRVEQLCRQRYHFHWNLATGPQVRLEQYALPGDRTRFRITWPHLMMDAEGAQWLLLEISRQSQILLGPNRPDMHQSSPTVPLQPPVPPDDQAIDVLAGHSLAQRLRLFRRGFSRPATGERPVLRPILPDRRVILESFGLTHRLWEPSQVAAIQANAKRVTPPGPALYARHLAACVVRALHRIYGERGIQTDAYLITFPMRPSLEQTLRIRPIPGNYLVSPVLRIGRNTAGDTRAIGEEIVRQLESYRTTQGDLAQWAVVWAASFSRARLYDLLLRLPMGFESLMSGFSFYGEITPPIRSFAGLKVLNFWGGGPLGSPPGWNPVFSRFADRLNLSLTWNRPAIPDDLAHRYAQLIEEEVLGSP